ncbi:MAG: hypothetical protein U0625_12785 [Phycisphaerales bacterium]
MQLFALIFVLITSLLGFTPRALAADSDAAARFKAAGAGATLTVLPARLAGRPMVPVGNAVALMLERAGMTALTVSHEAWEPPAGADLAATATALGERVRAAGPATGAAPATAAAPATEFTLFADILGTPKDGITELRAVVVDSKGRVAWQERYAKGVKAWDRSPPREPLDCCILLAKELGGTLGLADPTRADAPEGPIARSFRGSSGIPDDAELATIAKRGAQFRKDARTASIIIYPAHAGDAMSAPSAAAIAQALKNAGFAGVRASATGPELTISRDMNEQKVLWSMARGFRDRMRAQRPDADYAVFADYVMGPGGVGAVHFAVCDRAGELVLVDFQNDHFEDFRAVAPKGRDGADALVVRRMTALVGK